MGVTYADSAVIDDFSIQSEIVQGEDVSVAVTISYDFTSETTLNPGIFSFEIEDWIVEEMSPASGSNTVVYVFEFPTPTEDGVHQYQANVWYIVDDEWFIDGAAATHNFTITIGELNTSSPVYHAEILEYDVPVKVDPSSQVNVSITIGYEFPDENEVRLMVMDQNSEIINEMLSLLSGTNQKDYGLTILTPDTPGEYAYSINMEYESNNLTQMRTKEFSLNVLVPENPEPEEKEPETPEEPEPETNPEVESPTTTESETTEPEEPEKTGGIPGFDVISIVAGSLLASRFWGKKD